VSSTYAPLYNKFYQEYFQRLFHVYTKSLNIEVKFVSVSKPNAPTICSNFQTDPGFHSASCSMGPVVVSLRESYLIVRSKFLKNISLGPCSATVSCLMPNPGLLNLLHRASNFWLRLVCMRATGNSIYRINE
jgi:hypothetical protein